MHPTKEKPDIKIHDLEFELMISEKEIRDKTNEIGRALTEKFKDNVPVLLGVLNGSFIFMADLMRACNMPCEVSFIKLSSYSGTKSTGIVKSVIGLQTDLDGRDVIIVEDIIDSGETMHQFLPQLMDMNPSSVTIVSLLVKPTAMKYNIRIDHIGFEIPEKFVVGYGLDYNEQGRNLKDIYQLKKGG